MRPMRGQATDAESYRSFQFQGQTWGRTTQNPTTTPLHSFKRFATSFSISFDMSFWQTLMISCFKLE